MSPQVVSLKPPDSTWTEEQHQLFMRIRTEMKAHPESFLHPWAEPINARDWHVLCWTVAWFAAQCIRPGSTGTTKPAGLDNLKEIP